MLCRQVESLAAGEANVMGVLANVSAAMKTMFPEEFFWVGFYLVSPSRREGLGSDAALQRSNGSKVSSMGGDLKGALFLGPFQGTVACYEIPYGKGVCGTAWKERRTLVVPDVEAFPGHIACSSLSRSEVVVPMFDEGGNVWGVIDIDSTELNTFDEVDAEYLEKIAKILSKELHGLI